MTRRNNNRHLINTFLSAALVFIVGSIPAHADIGDVVLVNAWSTDFETDYVASMPGQATFDDTDRAEACDALTEQMNPFAEGPSLVSDVVFALPEDARQDFIEELHELREELCEEEDLFVGANIIYTSCAMYMESDGMQMLITVPPAGSDAVMQILSPDEPQPIVANLTRVARDVDVVKKMEGPAPIITPLSGRQEFLGVEAREHKFEYTARGSMTPGMPMNLGQVTMKSSGTAWLAQDVPGYDVIKAFYNTFANEVQTGGPAEQMLGGLVRQMSSLIDRGFPMLVDTTVEVNMIGAPMVGMGRTSQSVSHVSGVAVLPGSMAPAPVNDLCTHSIIPEGVEPISLNEMMSEAAAGADGQDAAEMQQAMQDMNEAYANMTPEQQAMMQSMGIEVPTATQAGAAGAVAAAPGPSMSAALTTDNMTQTVQNHLEFLGYNTGNTDGDLSIDTQVAISQFQAEMGIAVTGEVTPQLLGLLAAEVDSR